MVRMSDLVPLWIWEADILRTRPALMDVCDRMLSMELWHYRQHCRETTPAEKQLLRDHEPYLTPMGRPWRTRTLDTTISSFDLDASLGYADKGSGQPKRRESHLPRIVNVKRAKHHNKTNQSATNEPRLNRAKATSSNTQPRYGRNSFQHDEDNDAESDVNSSSSNSGNSSSSSREEEEKEEEEVQEQDDEMVTNGNGFRGKSTNKGWTTSLLFSTSAAGSRRAQRPKPRRDDSLKAVRGIG